MVGKRKVGLMNWCWLGSIGGYPPVSLMSATGTPANFLIITKSIANKGAT